MMDKRTLTRQQYTIIMSEIWNHHRFGGLSNSKKKPCRYIKYVRPAWDMRYGNCFFIVFDDHQFDFRDSETRTMYDRIMSWLEGEEVPQRPKGNETTAQPSEATADK